MASPLLPLSIEKTPSLENHLILIKKKKHAKLKLQNGLSTISVAIHVHLTIHWSMTRSNLPKLTSSKLPLNHNLLEPSRSFRILTFLPPIIHLIGYIVLLNPKGIVIVQVAIIKVSWEYVHAFSFILSCTEQWCQINYSMS